ncbi:MAG TPA: tat pathway signal sequence [Pseudonocardiaceae bacterium]|nr:tat pathway signal sequence [Pseudonocardiaceae bacterium]
MVRLLRSPVLLVAVLLGMLLGAAGCGSGSPAPVAQQGEITPPSGTASSADSSTSVTSTSSTPSPQPVKANPAGDCPYPQSGFDCDFQRRFAAVEAYIKTRPGTVGIVVRDRQTGAVWRNEYANTMVWTASTIKLAMTVDLFLRDRAGTITLSAGDRDLIQRMLHSSDDNAADSLWFKYSGPDHMTFNNDFPRYGMTSLSPKAGYIKYFPYWGFQKCTPNDLDRLINYVLTQLPSDTRDYIVNQLKNVDVDQQWGVWGAGPAASPGNKDGWSLEDTGWVMNSVGYVGPGERYTVAMMNSLNRQGVYADGQATDNHVSALLFGGRSL